MKHSLDDYMPAKMMMNLVACQLAEHPVVRMNEDFEAGRTTLTKKQQNQCRREVASVADKLYPLQTRMVSLARNLSFLLENAHNRVSYAALAKHFAEYEVVAKRITQHANKHKNNVVLQGFLRRATMLDMNYFRLMEHTLDNMELCIRRRMQECPHQYIDLDPEVDAYLDRPAVIAAYKQHKADVLDDMNKTGA